MADFLDQQLAAIRRELSKPYSIGDYLRDQLTLAVNAQTNDAARLHFLAIEQGKWALRYREFCRTGDQPFGGPHPEYGAMAAADFIVLLGSISARQDRIKARMREVAHV